MFKRPILPLLPRRVRLAQKAAAETPAIIRRHMNFGLDLRPSLVRPTGVGTYVLGLARRLPAQAPADRFFYFSASLRDRYPITDWPANVSLVDRPPPGRAPHFAGNRLRWAPPPPPG